MGSPKIGDGIIDARKWPLRKPAIGAGKRGPALGNRGSDQGKAATGPRKRAIRPSNVAIAPAKSNPRICGNRESGQRKVAIESAETGSAHTGGANPIVAERYRRSADRSDSKA